MEEGRQVYIVNLFSKKKIVKGFSLVEKGGRSWTSTESFSQRSATAQIKFPSTRNLMTSTLIVVITFYCLNYLHVDFFFQI